jgi:hypothetical protein
MSEMRRVGWVGCEGEAAPGVGWLDEPWCGARQVGWQDSFIDNRFLGVNSGFDVRAESTVDDETRRGTRCDERRGAVIAKWPASKRSKVVFESEIKGIVNVGGITFTADGAGDAIGNSEKGEGLIYQMGAEVEKQATAGFLLFSPRIRSLHGAEVVKAGSYFDRSPETPGTEKPRDRKEITIPAAVLKRADEPLVFEGKFYEATDVGRVVGYRFVNDYVLACDEGTSGEIKVGRVGRADDHEVDIGIDEEFINGAKDASVRPRSMGRVARALDNSRELKSWYRRDEGAMKNATS